MCSSDLDRVTLLLEPGPRGAGGIEQPAGGRDQFVETGASLRSSSRATCAILLWERGAGLAAGAATSAGIRAKQRAGWVVAIAGGERWTKNSKRRAPNSFHGCSR